MGKRDWRCSSLPLFFSRTLVFPNSCQFILSLQSSLVLHVFFAIDDGLLQNDNPTPSNPSSATAFERPKSSVRRSRDRQGARWRGYPFPASTTRQFSSSAVRCRFISRTTASAFRYATRTSPKSASGSRTSPFSSSAKTNSSPLRSFDLSRTPSELGGVQSLLPLHSAVSLARMTSHLSTSSQSCRSLLQVGTGARFDLLWNGKETTSLKGGIDVYDFLQFVRNTRFEEEDVGCLGVDVDKFGMEDEYMEEEDMSPMGDSKAVFEDGELEVDNSDGWEGGAWNSGNEKQDTNSVWDSKSGGWDSKTSEPEQTAWGSSISWSDAGSGDDDDAKEEGVNDLGLDVKKSKRQATNTK